MQTLDIIMGLIISLFVILTILVYSDKVKLKDENAKLKKKYAYLEQQSYITHEEIKGKLAKVQRLLDRVSPPVPSLDVVKNPPFAFMDEQYKDTAEKIRRERRDVEEQERIAREKDRAAQDHINQMANADFLTSAAVLAADMILDSQVYDGNVSCDSSAASYDSSSSSCDISSSDDSSW